MTGDWEHFEWEPLYTKYKKCNLLVRITQEEQKETGEWPVIIKFWEIFEVRDKQSKTIERRYNSLKVYDFKESKRKENLPYFYLSDKIELINRLQSKFPSNYKVILDTFGKIEDFKKYYDLVQENNNVLF